MRENIISKNNKIKIIVMTVLLFLISIIGISYAYFTINVTGNEEASSISLTTANLKLEFTDGPGISVTNATTGWSTTKTFSVKNTGDVIEYYDIKLSDVFTTIIQDELVYTLTSTNDGGTRSESIMPNNDGLIKAKVAINPNVTQTYTMTITFKETNDIQDYNQGTSYRGIIQIISPYTYVNNAVQNIKLTNRIMLDNTEAYPANTSSKYVTSGSGIDYSNPSDYAYDGYFVYEEDVNFTSNANKGYGTTFTLDNTSGLFILTGTTATSKSYSTDDIGKYTCNNNSTTCYSNPQDMYKILEVSGTTITKVERYLAKPNKSSWNGLGLYQTSTNTEGNQPTYFFRGHVINNYVKFAGDIWRIIRINEDGTIRLVRQTSYASGKFFTSRDKPMHVGFKFGTDNDPYANDNDSTIKTSTESYYTSKLTSLSSYLADAGFCNDREVYSTSGTKIYYKPYNRLVTNKAPIFKCLNSTRDLFTTSSASVGNNALNYPVGLITADEMAYAGGVNGKLSKFYLVISSGFWTISPSYYNGSYAYIFYSYTGGVIGYVTSSGSDYAIRPVVNLKADTLSLGGTGTVNDPYIITQ